jgi:hypothetical protein
MLSHGSGKPWLNYGRTHTNNQYAIMMNFYHATSRRKAKSLLKQKTRLFKGGFFHAVGFG